MRCWECRLEFDEINESQPVCPGCGQLPIPQRDHPELPAVDEVGTVAMLEEREAEDDDHFDTDSVPAAIPLPIDLREAADDAEGLLEATGLAGFLLPEGFRLFPFPTGRVM
jgi:hypothetical protein